MKRVGGMLTATYTFTSCGQRSSGDVLYLACCTSSSAYESRLKVLSDGASSPGKTSVAAALFIGNPTAMSVFGFSSMPICRRSHLHCMTTRTQASMMAGTPPAPMPDMLQQAANTVSTATIADIQSADSITSLSPANQLQSAIAHILVETHCQNQLDSSVKRKQCCSYSAVIIRCHLRIVSVGYLAVMQQFRAVD
jgi:hypothetical protein